MRQVAENYRHHSTDTQIPSLERLIYWAIWLPASIYPFYIGYRASKKYHGRLPKDDFVLGWYNIQKDVTDYEWQFWNTQMVSFFLILIPFSVLGFVIRKYIPDSFKIYQLVASICALTYVVTFTGIVYMIVNATIFYAIALFMNRRSTVWVWCLVLIYILSSENKGIFITIDTEYNDMIQYGLLLSSVRFIYFTCRSMERCDDLNFMNFLHYVFYLPLFFNGPIFDYYQFNIALGERKDINIADLIKDIVTCVFYSLLFNVFFSFVYTSSISYDIDILNRLTALEVASLVWIFIQVFYVKYVIFYRSTGIFVKIDGLEPPLPPKCLSTFTTFTQMWRHFDTGLHRFLWLCIYLPLGGSAKGVANQLFVSGLCFSFVALWHGNTTTLWIWAITNFLGIAIEKLSKKLSRDGYFDTIYNDLSSGNRQRLYAGCGVLTSFPLMFSNMIFLVGHHTAFSLLHKLISDVLTLIAVLFALYCGCHCQLYLVHS